MEGTYEEDALSVMLTVSRGVSSGESRERKEDTLSEEGRGRGSEEERIALIKDRRGIQTVPHAFSPSPIHAPSSHPSPSRYITHVLSSFSRLTRKMKFESSIIPRRVYDCIQQSSPSTTEPPPRFSVEH